MPFIEGLSPLKKPHEADLPAACLDVQAAVTVLNRCLARSSAVEEEHHDILKTTWRTVSDLVDLLKGLVLQGQEIYEKEAGDWILLDIGGTLQSPKATPRKAFQILSPSLAPKSAHDIIWNIRNLTLDDDEPDKSRNSSISGGEEGRRLSKANSSLGRTPSTDSVVRSRSMLYSGLDCMEEVEWGSNSFDGNQNSFASQAATDQYLFNLFSGQGILAKTIKNDEWMQFFEKLHPAGIRTSTSLLPPFARNMRLFGSETARCGGLAWDRNKLDLQDYWAWPSGYYAKTEFNIDANGRLKNGREEALVLIEDLVTANTCFTTQHSYNEVYSVVTTSALAAVFCRTTQVQHLLFCMGIRDFIRQTFSICLPIVILDPVQGVRPFGENHQLQVIQKCIKEMLPVPQLAPGTVGFIDLSQYSTLKEEEIMMFHGLYGCTESCLRTVLDRAGAALKDRIFVGLESAVKADNVTAAMALVKQVYPMTIKARGLSELAADMHALCFVVGSADMLIPIGAYTALCFFVSGKSINRIQEACQVLEEWITHSSSLSFRMQSWKELRDKHADDPNVSSSMMPFLGQKAITNRTAFHQALLELGKAQNAVQFFMRLCSLLAPLQNPCLRLDLIQYITGLHAQFIVTTLKKTSEFAFQCVAEGAQ